MLKNSASFVLASFRPSTGTQPPHYLGGAHRRGAPYSSHRAPQRVRLGPSLAAALLDSHFEQPAKRYESTLTAAMYALTLSFCRMETERRSQRRYHAR